jgi:hypothetical protein
MGAASVRADRLINGRTDMMKLIVAFLNMANVQEKRDQCPLSELREY